MLASELVSRLSTQMTLWPAETRWSQRCEPRNPAPPVTTAVGITSMLAAPSEDGGALTKDLRVFVMFTSSDCVGCYVRPDARAEAHELVGPGRSARRRARRDPARRLRRLADAAARDAAVHEVGARRRPHRRCDGLLRRVPRVHGRLEPDAAGRPGTRCAIRTRRRGRDRRRLAAPERPSPVARGGRARRLRGGRRGRRPLDEGNRRGRLRLVARVGAADARLPRARLRAQQARRLGLRLRALAALRPAHRRGRRPPRPERDRPPLGGRAGGRRLGDLAATRRRNRRPSRLGERAVGDRHRPAQLRRAAVNAPGDLGRGAAALAAPDPDASRARGLRARRRDRRQGLERAARRGGTRGRAPARRPPRRASVPRRRARLRPRGARLLAALVSEALRQPAVVAARPVRRGPRRLELDAFVDLYAAHAGDRRSARARRDPGRPQAVGTHTRARVPAAEPDLLQLLCEHGAAPPLPVREPARAPCPVGRGRCGAGVARPAAPAGGRAVAAVRAVLLGWVVLLAACSLPSVGLWDPNGKADTGLYSLYGGKIAHGHLPYRSGFSMEFPPGAIPPLAVPALPRSHYVSWFKAFELLCGLAAVAAVAFALAGGRPLRRYGAG